MRQRRLREGRGEDEDYERDDLVVDVADALTLHQQVQWDRCERLATPANR